MTRSQFAKTYALAAMTLAMAGCATFQDHEKKIAVKPEVMNSFLADKPEPTKRLYRNVLEQGERNLVLNHMRAGLAAMEVGDLPVAERSFDVVTGRIETIYANDPKADEARSNFIKENIKDFKGEAYERAMAFYYRGLLYLMKGDYGNAQAAFGDGILQDTYAESEKYAQDFATLAYLRGWAYRCQGSATGAEMSFREAARLHKQQFAQKHPPLGVADAALVAPTNGDNVLLVGETGAAPRKMAAGQYRERLTYLRGPWQPPARVVFHVDSANVVAPASEDVFWQAETRGGRPVDYIMDGKASFKGTTDTVGNAMLAAGVATATYAGYTNDRNAAIAGGILVLGGLIAKGISNATRPDADLRQWDNLPEHIHLTTVKLDPAADHLKVSFLDANGNPGGVPDQNAKVRFAGGCGIVWARSKSALDIPNDAPESGSPAYIIPEPKAKFDANADNSNGD